MNNSSSRSLRERAFYSLQRARGIAIETDLAQYRSAVREPDTPLARIASTCRRTLQLDPYEEQLVAAAVMYQGKLAQMETGEGKTLAAAIAASLSALEGRRVHVFTANDYLARRDADWMRPLYESLGITVGSVQDGDTADQRRRAYACSVTYLTSRQGGFDLLRDGLCREVDDLVHPRPDCAIVDEADFILIDEARIPLVIACADEEEGVDPYRADELARSLVPREDFAIDRAGRRCSLTLSGWSRVAELLSLHPDGGWETERAYASVHVALHAHNLLQRNVDYIVRGGRIEHVDETTGRVALDRRWPYGVQRALEAKEGLTVQPEGRVRGSITVGAYLGQYRHLAAMTATAVPAAAELYREHNLATVVIPPHRRDRTVHRPDRVFATREAKEVAVVETVVKEHASGRPILVGTCSVRESLRFADALRTRGIECQVLNAANDAQEAELVARAGMRGTVTVSTNMAGRGTDIALGGPQGIGRDSIRALGGLLVIGTNRHESARIDNQLRGRAGRQGDPGETAFYVSLEDDLIRRYGIVELLPEEFRGGSVVGEISDRRVNREIARAQYIIEEQHASMRRTLRRYTIPVEQQRVRVQMIRDAFLAGDSGSMLEAIALCADAADETSSRVRDALAAWDRAGHRCQGRNILRRVALSAIDEMWTDHLALVDQLREGIHLQRLGGKDPFLVFLTQIGDTFDAALDSLAKAIAARFEEEDPAAPQSAIHSDPQTPAATWVYLVHDDPFPAFRLSLVGAAAPAAALAATAVAAVRLVTSAVSRLWRWARSGAHPP